MINAHTSLSPKLKKKRIIWFLSREILYLTKDKNMLKMLKVLNAVQISIMVSKIGSNLKKALSIRTTKTLQITQYKVSQLTQYGFIKSVCHNLIFI